MSKKSLITICSFLVFTFLMIGTALADVYGSVLNANNAVQIVAFPSFKETGLKAAYVQDIEGINETLVVAEAETETADKNELYQDALNAVDDLIAKTDGCVGGVADEENWIVDCTDSSSVLAALNQLAADISALIQ